MRFVICFSLSFNYVQCWGCSIIIYNYVTGLNQCRIIPQFRSNPTVPFGRQTLRGTATCLCCSKWNKEHHQHRGSYWLGGRSTWTHWVYALPKTWPKLTPLYNGGDNPSHHAVGCRLTGPEPKAEKTLTGCLSKPSPIGACPYSSCGCGLRLLQLACCLYCTKSGRRCNLHCRTICTVLQPMGSKGWYEISQTLLTDKKQGNLD